MMVVEVVKEFVLATFLFVCRDNRRRDYLGVMIKRFMSVIIIALLVSGGGAFFAARVGLSYACTYSVRPASNAAWGVEFVRKAEDTNFHS